MKTKASAQPSAGAQTALPSVRERVLDAAATLFYRQGIHSVGVDAIVAASGVAKMSFYRHFPSKDDLIRAVLVEHDRRYWRWWDEAVALHAEPRAKLRALIASIAERFQRPSYRGCAFINFTAEFARLGHPGCDIVTANKLQQRERLRALVQGLGVADPDLLADQLVLLVEGARVSALTLGDDGVASRLPQAVESLVAGQLAQRTAAG